jgi:hypothetical protein
MMKICYVLILGKSSLGKIMRKSFLYLFGILFLASCGNKNEEFTLFHEDGRAKPVVKIAPVIDATNYDISWSLSEEFTELIVNRIAQKGALYIPKEKASHVHISQNPFGNDLSWIKNHYKDTEFVVFTELLEHEDIISNKKLDQNINPKKQSHDLNISIRVRVVDLRYKEPKIVLQEIIKDVFYISKNVLHSNYDIVVWGTEEYSTSQMGLAHFQITKRLVNQVNDYILLAKSR